MDSWNGTQNGYMWCKVIYIAINAQKHARRPARSSKIKHHLSNEAVTELPINTVGYIKMEAGGEMIV